MSWNFDTGNGRKAEFTKFPVGVTKIRVLDEAPFIRWMHWLQKFSRGINCPGKDCPICAIRKQQKANQEQYTYNMSRKFAMNIYNFETDKTEIMEQGINFFEDLRDLKADVEEDGNRLQDAVIKVRRRGTGKDDTSYRLDVEEISSVDLSQFEEDLIDLSEFFAPHNPEDVMRLLDGESWEDVFGKPGSESDEEIDERVEVR